MSKQANSRLIGGFIVGAVALIVVIFLVFGSGKFFKKYEEYVIFFRGSVNGLKVGAPVKTRGVEIGSVKNIRGIIDKEANYHIEVIVEADPDAFDVIGGMGEWLAITSQEEALKFSIDKGLRAQLASESLLTGLLYINVDYFPETPVTLVGLNKELRDLEVPSIPTSSEELSNTLKKALKDFEEMPLPEITRQLLATLQGVDSLVSSPEVKETIIALNKSLTTAEKLLANFDERMETVSSTLLRTSKEMDEAMDSAEKLLKRLETIAQNDRYELQVALKEFAEANRAMRNLLDYLQRNPGSLVHGKK